MVLHDTYTLHGIRVSFSTARARPLPAVRSEVSGCDRARRAPQARDMDSRGPLREGGIGGWGAGGAGSRGSQQGGPRWGLSHRAAGLRGWAPASPRAQHQRQPQPEHRRTSQPGPVPLWEEEGVSSREGTSSVTQALWQERAQMKPGVGAPRSSSLVRPPARLCPHPRPRPRWAPSPGTETPIYRAQTLVPHHGLSTQNAASLPRQRAHTSQAVHPKPGPATEPRPKPGALPAPHTAPPGAPGTRLAGRC